MRRDYFGTSHLARVTVRKRVTRFPRPDPGVRRHGSRTRAKNQVTAAGVHGDGIVVQVPRENFVEPRSRLCDGMVPSSAQFHLDRLYRQLLAVAGIVP